MANTVHAESTTHHAAAIPDRPDACKPLPTGTPAGPNMRLEQNQQDHANPEMKAASQPGRAVTPRSRALASVFHWLYPVVLFALDLATWMACYALLALVFDKEQNYGIAELILPPLVMG